MTDEFEKAVLTQFAKYWPYSFDELKDNYDLAGGSFDTLRAAVQLASERNLPLRDATLRLCVKI